MDNYIVKDIKEKAKKNIHDFYLSFDPEHRKNFVRLAEEREPERFQRCEWLKKKLDQETDPEKASLIAEKWRQESIDLIRTVMISYVIKLC